MPTLHYHARRMTTPARQRGRFLVLDGVDGCGKTTQARLLCERLEAAGEPAPLHLREPGGTPLGERLRELLLSREHTIHASTEALLFCASRSHMLRAEVAPALSAGRHVVCERFNPSTFAYQCAAGQLDEERVLQLLTTWSDDPTPDRVFLLQLDADDAHGRRGAASDRIEDKGLEFQRAVARGYERYAELVPSVTRIDAARAPEDVAESVWLEVRRVL